MDKQLLKLAIPNILSNLTIPLVSLVDVGLMGHLPNAEYIVSIGFGVMVFNFIYWSFGFLRMGTTGVISQAFGANDFGKITLVLKQSLFIGFIGSILLLIFQYPIFNLSASLIDSIETTEYLLKQYYNCRIWAAPATILTYVFIGWFLGMQNSKAALYVTLIINIANVLFSYLLVYQFNLEILGVALGTVISQYLGFVFCLIYFRMNYFDLWLRIKNETWKIKSGMRDLLILNGNIFIRTFCLISILSIFKVKAGNLETDLAAANILLLEFITISAYGIDGFAFAAESISGRYFGTRNIELFQKSVKTSFKWGILSGFAFALVFFLWGENILQMLTDKQKIIDIAIDYLPWLILAPIVNAIAFIWDGIYIGATASKLMRNTMLASALLFLMLYQSLFNNWGNHGLWLTLLLFMLTRGVLQTWYYKTQIIKNIY